MRVDLLTALVVGLTLLAVATHASDPPGTPRSKAALDACTDARASTASDRGARLDRAVALAEEAIVIDERDPVGHFALFCSLGERAREAGVSFKSVAIVRRMRAEIERALELDPEYTDALAGKGAFLMNLPRMMGGSCGEGEKVLRRALAIDPNIFDARMELARGLEECGDRKTARVEAQGALVLAERKGDPKDVTTARALLNGLQD